MMVYLLIFYPFVLLAVQNNTDNDYKNRGYF